MCVTYLIVFICGTYLFLGTTDCALNLYPHPPPRPNCFLIVLRQLSECSHEGAVYGARRRVLPPNTYTGICAAQRGHEFWDS